MKKAVITGNRTAGTVEVPVPKAESDQVLVKVHVSPMCTEYKLFADGTPSDCLGHEAAGEVIDTAQDGPVKAGDRVVVMPLNGCGRCHLCQAGDFIHCEENQLQDTAMAQYVLKPAFMLKKIPDGVSYEKASLACCGLGASFGAIQKLQPTAYDTVLITGLGPVGLGAVINAKFLGTRVIAVDSNQFRTEMAKKFGVEEIVDPRDAEAVNKIKNVSDGFGPDYAIDCSGAPAAQRLCIDSVRRKGKVAFVGESHANTPISVSRDMIRKGLTLVGSWHYNLNDFSKLMKVIQHSPLVDHFVTHEFPMSEIQYALETSSSQKCGKILLKPWE